MTKTPASEILRSLSTELERLAAIARQLDEAVGSAPMAIGHHPALRDLQRADALSQYLADMARLLTRLSACSGFEARIDPRHLADAAVLDDVRRMVLAPATRESEGDTGGHIEIF